MKRLSPILICVATCPIPAPWPGSRRSTTPQDSEGNVWYLGEDTCDSSHLEPDLDEEKVYCPGIGNVFVLEPGVEVELLTYAGL